MSSWPSLDCANKESLPPPPCRMSEPKPIRVRARMDRFTATRQDRNPTTAFCPLWGNLESAGFGADAAQTLPGQAQPQAPPTDRLGNPPAWPRCSCQLRRHDGSAGDAQRRGLGADEECHCLIIKTPRGNLRSSRAASMELQTTEHERSRRRMRRWYRGKRCSFLPTPWCWTRSGSPMPCQHGIRCKRRISAVSG